MGRGDSIVGLPELHRWAVLRELHSTTLGKWHMPSRSFCTLILSLGLVLASCSFVQGQSAYGSVAGSVTDPSGAALGDAQVILTNLDSSEKRTQSTGSDGLYSFFTVMPGR